MEKDQYQSLLTATPVLFMVFNRLETTKKVLSAIRQVKPVRFYISADGPRSQRPGEDIKVRAVRDYVLSHVDWECQVKTLFRDKNLGCKCAVRTAIDWFFEHEPEGIILEDDCVPDPTFFRYAEELLSRYRDDSRVMAISAQHFPGPAHNPQHSYFFSRYISIWGWASWRRAWRHYDREMSFWPALRDTDWLLAVGHGSKEFQQYWTMVFDRAHAGQIDTWDHQWLFSCWAQNGVGIMPSRNLVTNIGFGDDATHTKDNSDTKASLSLERLEFPLYHPRTMVRDFTADAWMDRYVVGITPKPLYKRLLWRIPGMRRLVETLRKAYIRFN